MSRSKSIVLGVLLASGAWAEDEPKMYTASEVEAWPRSEKMVMTALKHVPVPAPAETPQQPASFVAAGEVQARALAKQFGFVPAEPFKWLHYPHGAQVSQRSGLATKYYVSFEAPGPRLSVVTFIGQDFLDEIAKQVTPQLFEAFASKHYKRVFGAAPIGEAVFDSWSGGIARGHRESVAWPVIIDGARMHLQARVAVDRNVGQQWVLRCEAGPAREEVEAMKEAIRRKPVKVTSSEAIAIAWAHWKKIDAELAREAIAKPAAKIADRPETRMYSELVELHRFALKLDGPTRSEAVDRRIWRDPNFQGQRSDRVFHKVTIFSPGYEAEVLVDRETGAVSQLQRGTLVW